MSSQNVSIVQNYKGNSSNKCLLLLTLIQIHYTLPVSNSQYKTAGINQDSPKWYSIYVDFSVSNIVTCNHTLIQFYLYHKDVIQPVVGLLHLCQYEAVMTSLKIDLTIFFLRVESEDSTTVVVVLKGGG